MLVTKRRSVMNDAMASGSVATRSRATGHRQSIRHANAHFLIVLEIGDGLQYLGREPGTMADQRFYLRPFPVVIVMVLTIV